MITLTKEMEAIVKYIGTIKSVEGLEEYYQSLSVEQQNNSLLKGLIEKRKKTIKRYLTLLDKNNCGRCGLPLGTDENGAKICYMCRF